MTDRPLSTISYNSETFLREKLDTWVEQHIIQCYQYICHKGEDGDKDHIHVRIEPNKRLDKMDLTEQLKEYEKGKDKPRGVRPWRPSKEEDWILYAVHDEDYLRIKYGGFEKGEKLPYKWEDIKVSDGYDMEVAYVRAQAMMEHTNANLIKRLKSGADACDLVNEGENVHTVNAIVRTLNDTEFSKLAKKYYELKHKYECICDELLKIGLISETVKTKDGSDTFSVRLKKIDDLGESSKAC